MLKKQLIRDEGDVPYAYQTALGYLTIGVGFLIDKRKGGRLPDAVRDFWLDYEINKTTAELEKKNDCRFLVHYHKCAKTR